MSYRVVGAASYLSSAHTGTAQNTGDLDELDGDLGRLHFDVCEGFLEEEKEKMG